MADTVSFDSLLNTTAGMTAVVNNTKHDDDVVSVAGVDWFTYAGKTSSTIYVSGNNFIGFGQKAEQLKVCRSDGAVYYIYRQEGTLTSGKRFLKIRVEGYTHFSYTSSLYELKYEVFLIEGQTLFINVVDISSNNGNTVTSSITDGKTTINLNISVSSKKPISILVKNAGVAQIVSYEKFVDKYVTGITVSKTPDKTTYYQGESFDTTGLEVSKTYSDGTLEVITDYELSGFDSSSAGTKTITVTASGKTATFEITVLETSIASISVTTMPTKANYHIGKEFDSTGIVVTETTSDGSTIDVTKDCTYSGFDSSSPKTNTITVTYGILTTTFDITIMQPLDITGASYSPGTYFVGETTNISVTSITVSYSDGFEYVTSGYTVNNVVATEPGSLLITVEYFGVSTTVSTKVLDSFSVKIGTPTNDDVTAIFDLETNILSISGTGEFNNNLSNNAENITCPNSLYTRCNQIIFSDGITKIPSNFGSSFSNLENLVFGNDISEIGVGNFNKYLGTSLSFSESLVKISSGCFNDCPNLTEITFYEGLVEIGGSTFCGCSSLKNLILPSTLKSMPYCFQGCALENLEIGGEDAVFASSGEGGTIYNISAKNIVIRGGTIYSGVFSGKNIETLTLNGTVKWNGTGQFATCSELISVSIGKGISSIPVSCFASCGLLNNIVIPDSVTEIGANAFSGCTSLNSIKLSNKIKKIPDYCFSGCGFETFTISDDLSIEELGNVLFQACSKLKTVYIGKNVKTIASGAFDGSSGITIKINQTKDSISGSPWAASNATVEWAEAQLVKIEISSLPHKLKYKKGEEFDSSGLIVSATYDDGRVEETTSYTLSNPDMSTYGIKTITVTYQEKTATFAITVSDIVSIKVKEYFGNISSFFIGDENTGQYRYAAKSLTAIYGNGEEETIPYGKFTETPVDTSKEGTYYTTVSYDGKETRNPYTVYGSPFTIATGYPDKESATATLDLSTGICTITGTGQIGTPFNSPRSFEKKIKELKINEGITGIYRFTFCSNITLLEIPSTVEELSEGKLPIDGITGILGSGGFSTAIIKINAKKDSIAGSPWGQTSATIVWTAKPEKLNIVSLPTRIKYTAGDTFSKEGLECNVLYSNNKTYPISGNLSVSAPDMSKSGKKAVDISYTEDGSTMTATFQIEVVAEVTGIRISKFPQKVFYKVGEPLDLTGLEVVTVSGLGDEKAITDYEVSGFDSSKAGSKTITVSYNTTSDGVTKFIGSDNFQVKVTNDGKNPFDSGTGSSTGGGGTGETEENAEPVYVTVHWIDGEFEDLTHENGGIKANTFVLQESICSEPYFIFGGCISNQVTFETGHKQFWGTDEDSYPSGRIEVYLECNKTKIKVFTGRIASAERTSIYSTRKIVAYDYLYDLRNTDIARWYKNQTTDKKKKLTQKQFRDKLFEFIGLEQVETKLHWDDAYVPDTNNANEMNVVNILKDLCLQNDRFGWMNRDGKFEYLKLRQNSHKTGETTTGKKIYQYYDNAEVHLDTFKSFWAKEGRIWFPHTILTDPDPNRAFGFTQGEPTAQEAYENNVFYNRNSFFVGNEDWMDYAWNADEYGGISRAEPIINICYGTFVNQDLKKYYRAQAYTVEAIGNPLNTVGQTIELRNTKQMEDGTELEWYVHSYIMSRTLKLGNNQLIDTYSANNAPFNSNSRQLGKDTPEISATVNRTRSEMPVVSYEEFTDGTDEFTPATVDDFGGDGTEKRTKKVAMRCMKRIKKEDYDKLPDAIKTRKDTVFMTYKES